MNIIHNVLIKKKFNIEIKFVYLLIIVVLDRIFLFTIISCDKYSVIFIVTHFSIDAFYILLLLLHLFILSLH